MSHEIDTVPFSNQNINCLINKTNNKTNMFDD